MLISASRYDLLSHRSAVWPGTKTSAPCPAPNFTPMPTPKRRGSKCQLHTPLPVRACSTPEPRAGYEALLARYHHLRNPPPWHRFNSPGPLTVNFRTDPRTPVPTVNETSCGTPIDNKTPPRNAELHSKMRPLFPRLFEHALKCLANDRSRDASRERTGCSSLGENGGYLQLAWGAIRNPSCCSELPWCVASSAVPLRDTTPVRSTILPLAAASSTDQADAMTASAFSQACDVNSTSPFSVTSWNLR